MSTRWYPLYQKGNPQLRIFLPNFWMKLIRSPPHTPPNNVRFIVSDEMSNFDVKNYLEKIYKVNVVHVITTIHMGKFRRTVKGGIVKDDMYKVANVVLPKGSVFKFPDLYPEMKQAEEQKDEDRAITELQESFKELKSRNQNRPDVPGWFTV